MALTSSVSEKGQPQAVRSSVPVKTKMLLLSRDFLGEEFFKWASQDLEEMNRFRNEVSKRRPTEEEKVIMQINKPWISFYNNITSNMKEI